MLAGLESHGCWDPLVSPVWPRPSEGRFFGQVRLLYSAKRQGSGGRARQKRAFQGSEEQGGTQRQGPATCSVHWKAPHGLNARVMRVADRVGVVAQCLLGHNFDLRYPGAWEDRRSNASPQETSMAIFDQRGQQVTYQYKGQREGVCDRTQ